jgi:hypothetical protein
MAQSQVDYKDLCLQYQAQLACRSTEYVLPQKLCAL